MEPACPHYTAQRGWRQHSPHHSPHEGRSPPTLGVSAPGGSTAPAARGGSSAVLAAPWGLALGSVPAELGKRSFTLPYKSPGYFEAAAVGTQRAQNPSHLPGPLLEEEPVLPPARRRCPPSAAARTRSTFCHRIRSGRGGNCCRAPVSAPRLAVKVRQQPHPQALRPSVAPRLGSRSMSSCEGTCRAAGCSP